MRSIRPFIAALTLMTTLSCRCDDFTEEQEAIKSIEASSKEDFELGRKLLKKLQDNSKKRDAILDRPYTFIRSQTKYSGRLHRNYYQYWHVRPLFASRMLWEESNSDHKKTSFRKTFELYESYGVDGLATFAWPAPYNYDRVIKVLYDTASEMKLDPKKFHLMLEVASNKDYANIDDKKFNLIINNPYSFRINGKSLISSYHIDAWPAEKIGEYVDQYRKRSGNKTLFIPQIGFSCFKDSNNRPVHLGTIYEVYRSKGTLPATLLLRMMDYLRGYARACDGLYIGNTQPRPDLTMDEKFSDEILFPLFKGILAEPEFNGKKLLAAYTRVGYTSYHGSQHCSRDGTKTLRKCFDLNLKYRPDLIICPEWDELNEDTGFQPQVSCPMSTQRIIKYYMAILKGKSPAPDPGDDLSIPNMIISQRRQLMLGWKFDVELLNVPDTTKGEDYTVTLEILNASGEVVYTAPSEKFNTAEMKDKTFYLPSEQFKDCQVLCSKLTIDFRGKKQVICEGLPFTVLRATACSDKIYSNTPLRNVLRPEKADIKFTKLKKDIAPGVGKVNATADIQSPEKLASVEVIQDSREIFAYDPKNEYLQDDSKRRLFKLSWHYVNNPCRVHLNFSVDLENAPSALTFDYPSRNLKAIASKAFSEKSVDKIGRWTGNKFYGNADHWPKNRLISISTEDLDKAILNVKGVRTSGTKEQFSWQIPLKELGEYGVVSKVFEDGLMFALETQYRPSINPLPLDVKSVNFSRDIVVDNPSAILGLRAISEEGKVFWSKPFAFNEAPSKKTVPVYVYSNTAKKGVEVNVPENRVPDIKYDFAPRWGNILHTSAGREFYGHAGGYLATSIGFVGLEGAGFTIPFNMYSHAIFKGADRPAPVWVKTEDGHWALKFDGERGNFLALPSTFMPQRAGFTLSFEIKPDEVKPFQVLFNHGGKTYGGLNVSVKNGKFEMSYTRRTPDNPDLPGWSRKYFKTNIPLEAGKWQKVVITYDESTLTLSVNGKKESFPCEGIGLYFQQSHFGGRGERMKDGTVPFYKGLLRSLEIKHYVEK